MIDKTPIPGLDMNNYEAKTQINNFWNYLDELAAKNPEEYKKFIQTQMKKGLSMAEEIKKEKEAKKEGTNPQSNINEDKLLSDIYSQNILTKKEFKVFPFMCIEFKPTKIIKKNLDEDDPKSLDINNEIILRDINTNIQNEVKEIQNIVFQNKFLDCAFQSNVIQDRKIYLNIVYSDEFYPPTDEKGNFLNDEDILDEKNWKYIPTEFKYDGQKDSLMGTRCDFYDVIINKAIIDKVKQNNKLCTNILDYITRKFIIFSNDKFKLFTNSVKILQNKIYKGIDAKPTIFKSKLEMNKKVAKAPSPSPTNEANKKVQNNNMNKKDEIIIASQAKYDENKINEDFIKKSDDSDNKKEGHSLPELKIKSEEDNQKKVVIEEVGAEFKQIIPMKRKILSETEMEVKFFFDEFEHLRGMRDIDLQISENGIIIHLDNDHYIIDRNYEPIEMKFDFKVDPDKCTAKYSKKEKTLTVVIFRVK